jgi:hypothetical protein
MARRLHEVVPFTLPFGPVRIRPKEGHMKRIAESKMILDPMTPCIPSRNRGPAESKQAM